MSAPRITNSTIEARRRILVLGVAVDLLMAVVLVLNSGLPAMKWAQPGAILGVAMVGSLWLLYALRIFSHFILMGASVWSYMGRLEKNAKFAVPVVAFVLIVAGTPYWWWIGPVGLVWMASILFLWLSHRRVMRTAAVRRT